MEGLVVQSFRSNPLLWEGRKFVIRSWVSVFRSDPLIALYHDGIILRNLDPATRGKRKPFDKYDHFANITTRQHLHPDYNSRTSEAFACLDDLQTYLSASFGSIEMSHFTSLILRPYLKRLSLFALQALRREHKHESPLWTLQHVCFDFMLDSNWNVWMLDASADCSVQDGGNAYRSQCKKDLVKALGSTFVQVAEELVAGKALRQHSSSKSWLDGVDIGTYEVLVDETSPEGSAYRSVNDQVCKRKVYQDFRSRQTFGKRVVFGLLPLDGRPQSTRKKDLGTDRPVSNGPWKCPVCGYTNGAKAQYCDNCGAKEADQLIGDRGHAASSSHDHIDSSSGHWHEDAREHVNHGVHQEMEDFFSDQSMMPSKQQQQPFMPVRDEEKVHGPKIVSVSQDTCNGKVFNIKKSVEIIGNEIEPLRTSSYHACCIACAVNIQCKGFTFDEERFQCWTRSGTDQEGHLDGITSGMLDDSSGSAVFSKQQKGKAAAQSQVVPQSSEHARREYYRKRLTAIFVEHDPNKLPKVDILLDRYRGSEERFILRTEQQYEEISRLVRERGAKKNNFLGQSTSRGAFANVAAAEYRDSHGLTKTDYKERLTQIFTKHDPEKLRDVDAMLEKFHNKEMQLVQYLLDRYGA